MAKFVVFEKVSEAAFRVFPKKDLSDSMQTVVNLGSGLTAGFAAAIVSQPADTMLSKINKTKGAPGEGTMTRLVKIGKELGLKGSYTGIGARLFMVGTLTAFQFAIYGDLKKALGATGMFCVASLTSIGTFTNLFCHRRCRDRQINTTLCVDGDGQTRGIKGEAEN